MKLFPRAEQEGNEHGYSDAFHGKSKNHRPSVAKSLLSQGYLDDYLAAYNRGWENGLKDRARKLHAA
ncbi:MAG: hypothetical protein KGZ83_18730 [Sulfuricella sp.]|nr:hypothetical protein [Sulfuricella sp.]